MFQVRLISAEPDETPYFPCPAADTLIEKHLAAANLLHRALAENVLQQASSRQYVYAARNVAACMALAPFLPEEPDWKKHVAFIGRLRRKHSRKAEFWNLLGDSPSIPAAVAISPRSTH